MDQQSIIETFFLETKRGCNIFSEFKSKTCKTFKKNKKKLSVYFL